LISPLFSNLESERKELEQSARLHWIHWTVLAISICLTLGVWYFLHSQEQQRNRFDFDIEVNQTLELITERMQKYEEALRSGVATITALDQKVTLSQWVRFTKSLNIDQRYPGINGIGLVEEVLPAELPSYLAKRRKEHPNFNVFPEHQQPSYWPVSFIEPLEDNKEALGLDMAHEANRYSTALKAKQTGLPQITAPIVLVQDEEKTPGFLFCMPFYKYSLSAESKQQGEQFKGLVYAPFIVEKLMHGAMAQENRTISFRVLDQGKVLFDELVANNQSFDRNPQFKKVARIELYGRVWKFEIWSNKLFNDSRPVNKAWIILVCGLLVNLLLLAIFYYLAQSYRRALELSQTTFDFHQFRDFYLSSVVDNVNQGLVTIDAKGIIQTANQACEEIFGYQSDELIGKNIKMLMPTEIAEKHDRYLSDYQETGVKNIIGVGRELVAQTKFGKQIPIDLSVSEIELNGEVFFSGIIRDLTERTRHKNELLEAMQFQEKIIENLPDLLFVKNSKFEIVRANDAFMAMYPEDMQDKIIGFTTLEKYTPKESERFLKFDKIAMEDGFSETEETITFPDGVTRILYTKKSRFYDTSGEVFILGLARDITELKHSREQLLASNKQLDDFAYIASHDLKEPLRGIYNHAAFFLEDHQSILDDKASHKLERIIILAKKMESLITDLLYYSRLGRVELAVVDTDINEVISDINELMKDDKSVKIVVPKSLPVIRCDKIRIREVFNNLISNSIKYNESSTKEITIGLEFQKVEERGRRYVFYVKDNGIGIPKKFHQEIFRIFKRLHRADAYGGGTGSGLTFVQKIVEAHRGEVWVESKEGEGAIFYFSILADR
jgi:PAS domain S-box-containing protein